MTRGRDEWSNKWQQRSSLAPCSAGAGGQGGGIPGRGAGSSDSRSARFQTGGEAHRHRHHPRRWPAWDSTPQTGMLSERGMTHSVWEFWISATFESEGCVLKRVSVCWEVGTGDGGIRGVKRVSLYWAVGTGDGCIRGVKWVGYVKWDETSGCTMSREKTGGVWSEQKEVHKVC